LLALGDTNFEASQNVFFGKGIVEEVGLWRVGESGLS